MNERDFWRFVWLAGVRLPWTLADNSLTATRMMCIGTITLVVARYTGWNLLGPTRP